MTPLEWYKVGGAFVAVPLKNGSTAFRAAAAIAVTGRSAPRNVVKVVPAFNRLMSAHGAGPFTPHQVAARQGRRLLAVRDPVERFASLWRSLMGVCARGQSTSLTIGYGLRGPTFPGPGPTPEQLMDTISAWRHHNRHWLRQSAYMAMPGPGLEGVEIVHYRQLLAELGLEHLAAEWNPSSRAFDAPLPLEPLRRHYAEDFELWRLLEAWGVERTLPLDDIVMKS